MEADTYKILDSCHNPNELNFAWDRGEVWFMVMYNQVKQQTILVLINQRAV